MIDRSKARGANFYSDFDAHLKENPFVAGEAFSVADITALVTVDFAKGAIDMPIPDEAKHFAAWYERISENASSSA